MEINYTQMDVLSPLIVMILCQCLMKTQHIKLEYYVRPIKEQLLKTETWV